MIAFLAGTVAHKSSDRIYLDVNNVGYELLASTNTLSQIGARGDEALLFTYLHVRENEVSLYGFVDEEEKRTFLSLIDVSGIGPKVGLAVLSTLQPTMLAGAIATEDIALISSVPGIGKKTAQRLIIELKGKLDKVFPGAGAGANAAGAAGAAGAGSSSDVTGDIAAHSAVADAQAALFSMGFSAAEIADAIAGAPTNATSQELLKYALSKTGGAQPTPATSRGQTSS